jgi:hypothetical protein
MKGGKYGFSFPLDVPLGSLEVLAEKFMREPE